MHVSQLIAGLGIALLVPAGNLAGQLWARTTTCNMTPEIAREIIGGLVAFPSTRIHDKLYAQCLVPDDEGTRKAIVVCDLPGTNRVERKTSAKLLNALLEMAVDLKSEQQQAQTAQWNTTGLAKRRGPLCLQSSDRTIDSSSEN